MDTMHSASSSSSPGWPGLVLFGLDVSCTIAPPFPALAEVHWELWGSCCGAQLSLPARRGGKPSSWIQERGSCRAFPLLGAIQACFHGKGRSRDGALSTVRHGLMSGCAHISCYFTRVTGEFTAESLKVRDLHRYPGVGDTVGGCYN